MPSSSQAFLVSYMPLAGPNCGTRVIGFRSAKRSRLLAEMNIDTEEYTDDESEAPAGGGRAETSPMAMTPDRPSQAAASPRGESVPGEKVRELEEGLKRATFHDKDVKACASSREAVEAVFEGANLSDFLGRGKDLITPVDPAEPNAKRDLPRSPLPTQGSPVPRDSAKRAAARQKTRRTPEGPTRRE
jgi:hypothetical protein